LSGVIAAIANGGRPAGAPVRRLGRFELLRVLGRGAQASVWLAHDPRLDREVAVKLLDPSAGVSALSEWLHEARAVSRLTHPNIVPVFEADDGGGEPYLVFEYVQGPTLAEARRQKPQMPPRDAATLLLGVLDALAAAHEQGIVHRDLKPSNILLGSDGRPRVMDFGIAARVAGQGAAADNRIVGTPGYMSPEAARGETPFPGMDVFAAGVMLGELLGGTPLMREDDPYRYVARVQQEDLLLPSEVGVDDTLRAVVQRALARDRHARFDSARSMHTALQAWLDPATVAMPTAGEGHGTVDFLLRRMRHKTDFPALSSSVVRIQRVATSETETLASLSDEILKDVALTNKLLRMVNSAHFQNAAGGAVSTISRAVALVGFAGIRNMALSLVLLEHMNDKAHAANMKEEFLRALMAGTLAGELTPMARDSEEAFLGSMFQNLGRLLTEYYFPEEALQIRTRLASGGTATSANHAQRESAAARVLGIGFDELGAGIARQWGLPDNLRRAMRPPEGDAPGRALERGVERMRWLGRGANALTDALMAADGEAQRRGLAAAAEEFAPALGLRTDDILKAANASRERMADLARAMGISVSRDQPARRLLDTATLAAPALATGMGAIGAGSAAHPVDDATLVLLPDIAGAPTVAARKAESVAASVAASVAGSAPASSQVPAAVRLATGLDSVARAVAGPGMRLNEVLRLVLETLHAAGQFRRVVFCLRDPQADLLTGRFGLGDAPAELCRHFRIATRSSPGADLFTTLCARGADTLIADATVGTVPSRLPPWYSKGVNAPTFLLLPMLLKGAPFGLIYADKATACSIQLSEADMALTRALRDQAVSAFRQGEAGA
jgi:serine/threonine protein kinase